MHQQTREVRDRIGMALSALELWEFDSCEDVVVEFADTKKFIDNPRYVKTDHSSEGVRVITERAGGNYHTTIHAPNRNSFRFVGHRVSDNARQALQIHLGALDYLNHPQKFELYAPVGELNGGKNDGDFEGATTLD